MRRPEVRYPVLLDPYEPECRFPDVSLALEEPNGLLALGGNLQPQTLLAAYRKGIFPWYEEGQPILWWSPDPRLVLFPDRLRVSQSLRKVVRRSTYAVSFDRSFEAVVRACGAPRAGDHGGTWITEDMIEAYVRLHHLGHAHSVEAWRDGELVGGLYGVALGQVFFGESMFHRCSDASKVAFVGLVRRLQQRGFTLIDCQMQTAHLMRFGAELISRGEFLERLGACDRAGAPTPWAAGPSPSAEIS